MNGPGLLALELRRLLLSLAIGLGAWFATDDALKGAGAALITLVGVWGWQLSRLYRWFANPDELPPLGDSAVRSILHDVYVLRARGGRRESSLSSSHAYRHESIESMREAAMIINARNELLWCNPAAEYVLNIQRADEEGKRLSDLLPGKTLAAYLQEENFQKPLRIKRGSNSEICLQLEFSRFGASDRLVFVKDVTEQDKLERMRRDFVGNLSHELRTPLTVIKGYIETLPSLLAESKTVLKQPLDSMATQVARMESLIADLLWLSRIETVEGERKDNRVDVCDLAATVATELRLAWPHRNIELHLDSVHQLLGDEQELRSALSNLVVNALKYSDKGPVKIRWADSAVGPVLSVEDKGLGIAPKHIPRLTERFYRVDKSRSQQTSGTGLGLAIVKHVAVSHEAKLFVDSQLGKGSCFRLVFPNTRCANFTASE